MADGTQIEWTDATWNPISGCTRVSEGCRNCYAERLVATRLSKTAKHGGHALMTVNGPRWTGAVTCHDRVLIEPMKLTDGRRIFVNSLSDTFHKDVPVRFLDRMFLVMATERRHTFQVLTKRPDRAAEYLADPDLPARLDAEFMRWANEEKLDDVAHERYMRQGTYACRVQRDKVLWPLPNVWIGTSIEDQKTADERIPHLLKIPAAVRFLSCEPLLGPVEFSNVSGRSDVVAQLGKPALSGIDWVICGGESGPNARPMHPDWARSLRDQCAAVGVPFLLKQWGEWLPAELASTVRFYAHEYVSKHPGCEGMPQQMAKVGKKLAGRLLDGVTHDAFPEVRARG